MPDTKHTVVVQVRVVPYRNDEQSGYAVQLGRYTNGRWKTENHMAGLRAEHFFCSELLGKEEAKKQAEVDAVKWRGKVAEYAAKRLAGDSLVS